MMDLSFGSSPTGLYGSSMATPGLAAAASAASTSMADGGAGGVGSLSMSQLQKMTPAGAQKAATDFEAFFASQFLSEMFEDVKADSMFGGGSAEETFRPFLLDQYAKEIAKRGQLGIASSVMRSLLEHQEASG